ncbi:hypothetical protein [Acidianus hospitalis]|uniref:hypothetical protein n=1 Tax=Acidianus hospitalis TaxID=563177 RepID=UPI00064EAD9B|nr:hypothetical protein [Acidianus hospitalis]
MDFLPEINLSFSPSSEWNPMKRFLERAGWSRKSAYGMVVEYKENREGRRILAYYVPYSVNRKNWRIYLIK